MRLLSRSSFEFADFLAFLDFDAQGSSLDDRWIVVVQGVTPIVLELPFLLQAQANPSA